MAEFPPRSLQPLVEEIFQLLKSRNETISVAETVRTMIHLIEKRTYSDPS